MAELSTRLRKDLRRLYSELTRLDEEYSDKVETLQQAIDAEFDQNIVTPFASELYLDLINKKIPLQQGINLLILMVGKSPEPLKVAIALHQPKHLALVYTVTSKESYESLERFAREVMEMSSAAISGLSITTEAELELNYDKMRDQWQNKWKSLAGSAGSVALDITGGTKTMMAAAFEFATTTILAGNKTLPVWYMDFSDYGGSLRSRPQLENCYYRLIEEPVNFKTLAKKRKRALYAQLLEIAEIRAEYIKDRLYAVKDPVKRGHIELILRRVVEEETKIKNEFDGILDEPEDFEE